jgi:hypothetical protein
MLRPDLSVADVGELSTVHVSGVAEGANAWVDSVSAYYTLVKNFQGPVPANAVLPLAGSPNAGAAGAVWLLNAGNMLIKQSLFATFFGFNSTNNNSAVFQTLLTLGVEGPTGILDIDADASLSIDTAGGSILVELAVDGVQIPGALVMITPGAPQPANQVGALFARVAPILTPGPHAITLGYAPVTNGQLAGCLSGAIPGASAAMRVTEYA